MNYAWTAKIRKPFFAIALAPDLTPGAAETVLDSAYQQDNPNFVILLTETMRANLPARIAGRENILTLPDGTTAAFYQAALEKAAGWSSLIAFMDENVLFSQNALREARGKMTSRGKKMIAGRLTFPTEEGIGETDIHAFSTCFFDAAHARKRGFRFSGDRAADLAGLIRICGYYHHFKLKYFTDEAPAEIRTMNLLAEDPAWLGIRRLSGAERAIRGGLGRILFLLGSFLARRLLPLQKKRALLLSDKRARLDGALSRYADKLPEETEVLLDLRADPDRTRNLKEFLALIRHAATCRYVAYEEGFRYASCLKKRPGQEIILIDGSIDESVLP